MLILGRSRLVAVLFVTTVMGIPMKSKLNGDVGTEAQRTVDHTGKRQEIIYLQEDISKRSRKQESMAFLESYGKSLTAEGRTTNKTSNGSAYQDAKEYHRSSFEVLSADKNKGPPETTDTANANTKDDAYEVVSEHSSSADDSGPNADHESGKHSAESAIAESQFLEEKHGGGAGFHIVSPSTDKRPALDKDETVYGTIESRPLESISETSQPSSEEGHHMITQKYNNYQKHYDQNNNDFIPSSVISVGQNQIMQFPTGSEADRRIYETPNNPEDGLNSRLSVYPYRFQKTLHWPWRRRRHHIRTRHPIVYYVPFYPKRYQSEIAPFTSQAPLINGYGPKQQRYPERPYMGLVDDEGVRKQLIQSMFGLPLVQAQGNPVMPAQIGGPGFPVPQSAEVRSPIFQLQTLSRRVPATPFVPQPSEPGPLMIPTSPRMIASLVQEQALATPSPLSRWVDSPGYSRSEVLDNSERSEDGKGQSNDNDLEDDIAENESREEEGNYDDRGEEYSREPETYHNDKTTMEYEEQEEGRDDQSQEDEPLEEEEDENAVQRSTDHYDRDDESEPGEAISHDLELSSNSERPEYREERYSFADVEDSFPEERSSRFIPRLASTDTLDGRQAESTRSNPVFSRYSAPPREPHTNMYQRFTSKQRPAQPKMEISQMSASQARFLENKEHRDPSEYIGPVSKNMIPRRAKYVNSGQKNVLIRLNGKPLEDSAELRSKIIDGRIVQGNGKLIKSKGPVNVKISHANDAKHTKIIDIISLQKYKVYDTKSKIAQPAPMMTRTSSKLKFRKAA